MRVIKFRGMRYIGHVPHVGRQGLPKCCFHNLKERELLEYWRVIVKCVLEKCSLKCSIEPVLDRVIRRDIEHTASPETGNFITNCSRYTLHAMKILAVH
jgi:hypothetical protein